MLHAYSSLLLEEQAAFAWRQHSDMQRHMAYLLALVTQDVYPALALDESAAFAHQLDGRPYFHRANRGQKNAQAQSVVLVLMPCQSLLLLMQRGAMQPCRMRPMQPCRMSQPACSSRVEGRQRISSVHEFESRRF